VDAKPLFFDAVTLRNFAAADALNVCRRFADSYDHPRWTEEVCEEIARGVRLGHDECIAVQECAWLGAPIQPDVLDLDRIFRLTRALGDTKASSTKNRGEAESIHFSESLGGLFVTDDGVAFDFACRRLGRDRVLDTVDVLRAAVNQQIVSSHDAVDITDLLRASGRYLRRGHNPQPGHTYFE
jgi:hypothetical protein